MSHTNQFGLLTKLRYGPFFGTQFLGAFNDNVFKNALMILIAFQITSWNSMTPSTLINLAAGLFILPFFLFSATAGQLAEKYEKSRLIRYIKILEIFIMLLAAVGLYLHNVLMLLIVLFLLGIQATLFGPVKYSILPQHLRLAELVGGNGMLEMGTFLAILLGTVLGGILISIEDFGAFIVALTTFSIAVLGWFCSLWIPKAPAALPHLKINWNPFTETWRNMMFAYDNRTIYLSILGIAWFWLYGALFLSQVPEYTKLVLGGNEHVATLILTVFSGGIGVGSLLCEKLSGTTIEIGLVPFGSIGLSLFAILLFFATPPVNHVVEMPAMVFISSLNSWKIIINIFLIGMFAGFYIVPLYVLVQARSAPEQCSRLFAAINIMGALFMVFAAVFAIIMLKAGLTIPQLFLTIGLMNIAVVLYIYLLVPEFLMRFITWLLISFLYRVQVENIDNIPDHGPALLICNHISFIDALIVTASCRRPIRFVMDHHIFRTPVLGYIFRAAKTIPIASAKEDPMIKQRAYDTVATALNKGELVCIFPEGGITHTGEIGQFKRGVEDIIKRTPVNVIPIALRGLWGSFFSRVHGKAMSRFPRRIFFKIGLAVGTPITPERINVDQLRDIVEKLRGDWK